MSSSEDWFIPDIKEALSNGDCQTLAQYIRGEATTIKQVENLMHDTAMTLPNHRKVSDMLHSFKRSKALINLKDV